MKLSILFGACVLAVVHSSPAAGQHPIEAGVARDAGSGAPIECLHVALIDSADSAIAHAVTDSKGQFQIEAAGPGVYRVQFEVFGWAPLAGPVDTLADGDFVQRAYPLAFTWELGADTADDTSGTPDEEDAQRAAASRNLHASMRAMDARSGWRSPDALPADLGPLYPMKLLLARISGSVLASYIVDSTGFARTDSWHTIRASHRDFESSLRKTLPRSRWIPAAIGDRPVCALVFEHTHFYARSSSTVLGR